jgi:crotonobetainyl-CoA:carnitine CoA-transferase CaiB-like acyl-CoA transferase
MSGEANGTGPLAGVRILDLSSMMAGPMSTMVLAEQGADVIKVEPLGGDGFRPLSSVRAGIGAQFLFNNRGKRSLAVDLKRPEGVAAVRRLAADADVVLEQFRTGVADRLGVGHEALSAVNDDLIYAHLTGYGLHGPFAARRAYDPTIQAYSGVNYVQGSVDGQGPPQYLRTPIADKIAPLLLSQALTAALYQRATRGVGARLEVSMLHALVWWLWPDGWHSNVFLGDEPKTIFTPPNDPLVRTSDGRYIVVYAVSDAEWRSLSVALERPDWLTLPGFVTVGERSLRRQEMLDIIAEVVELKPYDHWVQRFDGADVTWAPAMSVQMLIDDPQLVANHVYSEYEHGRQGIVRQPEPAVHFADYAPPTRLAPEIGQHTREILHEAGYSSGEIEQLIADAVVIDTASPRPS